MQLLKSNQFHTTTGTIGGRLSETAPPHHETYHIRECSEIGDFGSFPERTHTHARTLGGQG